MPRGREYELKFALAPEAAARVKSRLGIAADPAGRQHLVSTYFDTAEGALRRQRVALRVREGGRRTVQTLKRAGASAVERDEWEREGGTTPDLAWLRTTPLGALFADEAVAAHLDPRFTVDVSRTVLPILSDGTTIEGALDEGAIRAGDHSLAVHELEFEHKGGPQDGVMRLARKLARDFPLVLDLSSKAERGYAIAESSWGRPTKEIPLDLARAKRLPDLFAAVMGACLHAFCRNAALIGGADDGEAVHKTRIALRHIRAALALFAPVLRRKRLKRVKHDVKWASDLLGAARDADVFKQLAAEDADRTAGRNTAPDAGGGALAAALEPRRRRAHDRLAAAMASARWRLLLLDLLAFSIDGVRRSKRQRAAPFARRRLRLMHGALARDARGLRNASPETLHALRKRAKMLRYDLDLLGALPGLGIGGKRVRRAGGDLHAMQETLGAIHDAEALAERVGETILRRRAPPKGVTASDWLRVVRAAQTLQAPPPAAGALAEAAAAARRLRRRRF